MRILEIFVLRGIQYTVFVGVKKEALHFSWGQLDLRGEDTGRGSSGGECALPGHTPRRAFGLVTLTSTLVANEQAGLSRSVYAGRSCFYLRDEDRVVGGVDNVEKHALIAGASVLDAVQANSVWRIFLRG